MNKKLRKIAKEAIGQYEYYMNGMQRLSNTNVKVTNIRHRKSDDIYIADITLYFGDDTERHINCEYDDSVIQRNAIVDSDPYGDLKKIKKPKKIGTGHWKSVLKYVQD
jgi:desulfoferrodoxin (superoxide reductase-like protein)